MNGSKGDGGAPLVCEGASGRWYVVGLVAWGEGCGKPGVPGAYVRVSYYRDFIDGDPTLNDDYPDKRLRPAGFARNPTQDLTRPGTSRPQVSRDSQTSQNQDTRG